MGPDDDRLETKTRGAVVVDLAEARERARNAPDVTRDFRDPLKSANIGFWILFVIALAAAYYFVRR